MARFKDRAKHVDAVESAVADLIASQARAVAKSLRSRTASASVPGWDRKQAATETADKLRPLNRTAALAAAGTIAKDLTGGDFAPDEDFDAEIDDRADTSGDQIAGTTDDDFSRIIDDSDDDEEAADELDAYADDRSGTRAALIGATEIAVAVALGAVAAGVAAQEDDSDGRSVVRRWVLGPSPCDECSANGDDEIGIDEVWPEGEPGSIHPNCLPGWVRVASGVGPHREGFGVPPLATMDRWYSGDLIEVATVGGRFLTTTPNHPVLRADGWVAAGDLQPGDDVVCCGGSEWVGLGDPNEHDRPPAIVEVVSALGEASTMTARSVPVAPEDFHGDGEGSEVAVVGTDRLLGDGELTPVRQPLTKPGFGSGLAPDVLDTQRAGTPLGLTADAPTPSLVGGGGYGSVLVRSAPVGIHLDGRLDTPSLDPLPAEILDDGPVADAALIADRLGVNAGEVALDHVSGIVRYPWSGHVYNFTTASGWYVGGGLVVHNCECSDEITWGSSVTGSARRPSGTITRALTAAAIPAHTTDTTDVAWDRAAAEKSLSITDGEAEYRKVYAWVDPEKNPDTKGAYWGPHHQVSAKGLPGAANMGGCSAAINSLNTGSPVPDADRQATYDHLAQHLKDGGADVPDLTDRSTDTEAATESITFDGAAIEALTASMAARDITLDLGALTAAADGAVTVTGGGGDWHSRSLVEGFVTSDGREFAAGSLKTRSLPLPLMCLDTTSPGHMTAKICGAITAATRDGDTVNTEGWFDTGPNGVEAQGYVERQVLRFVSIDAEVIDWELVIDGEAGEVDIWDMMFGGGDVTERYTDANLLGATICAFPAFPQAVITMADVDLPAASGEGAALATVGPTSLLTAAATLESMWWDTADRPPAEWFAYPDDPNRDGFVLTDDGRVYGYVAPDGLSHVGKPGKKVTVPLCEDYDRYQLGVVKALNSEGVVYPARTGPIVMGTGHAPNNLDWRATTRHYDNTGAAVADIAVGNDDHGVWFAGCVRPTITAEQLYVLNATRRVSGDWRPIEEEGKPTELELIGVLAVNAGGFPQKASLVASLVERWAPETGRVSVGMHEDQVTALVACMPPPGPSTKMALMARRIEALEVAMRPLRPLAMRTEAARVLDHSAP